jgi:hypothetical protein
MSGSARHDRLLVCRLAHLTAPIDSDLLLIAGSNNPVEKSERRRQGNRPRMWLVKGDTSKRKTGVIKKKSCIHVPWLPPDDKENERPRRQSHLGTLLRDSNGWDPSRGGGPDTAGKCENENITFVFFYLLPNFYCSNFDHMFFST